MSHLENELLSSAHQPRGREHSSRDDHMHGDDLKPFHGPKRPSDSSTHSSLSGHISNGVQKFASSSDQHARERSRSRDSPRDDDDWEQYLASKKERKRESRRETYYERYGKRPREHSGRPSDAGNSLRGLSASQIHSRIMSSGTLSEVMRHVKENREGLTFISVSGAVSKGAELMNVNSESDAKDFLELVEISRRYLPQMEAPIMSGHEDGQRSHRDHDQRRRHEARPSTHHVRQRRRQPSDADSSRDFSKALFENQVNPGVPETREGRRELSNYSNIDHEFRSAHYGRQRSRSKDGEQPLDAGNGRGFQRVHAGLLNSRIMKSLSLSELMRHVRENRQILDFRCSSAAVSKGAKFMNKWSQTDVNDFMELVEIARGYLPQMDARSLSTLLYSLAKAGQRNDDLIHEILIRAQSMLREFSPQGFSNCLWALATLKYLDGMSFIEQLLIEAEPKLRDFDPQGFSNTLWALATLKYSDGSVFIKQLSREAEPKLMSFNIQDICNFLWSLATLKVSSESTLVGQLLREADLRLSQFKAQHISMTIWSLASLDYVDGLPFVKQLLIEAEPKLRDFQPREISSTIWGLATFNYSDGSAFIKQLLREAEPKLREFKPQNLSNTLWALAKLDYSDGSSFVRHSLWEAERKLGDFKPQELANTLWALATLNHREGTTFIEQLLREAELKLRYFNPQDLASTLWALATLHYQDGSFTQQLLREAELKLRYFKPQDISNVLWALATLGFADGSSFVKQLLREADPKLRHFSPQDLSSSIWALATLNYSDGSTFIKQLLREAELKLRSFTTQDLCLTAWSLAVLDHSDAPSFLMSFLPLAYHMASGSLREHKAQSLQYLLLMEDRGHVTAEIKADPRYVEFRRACVQAAVEGDECTSRSQLEIFEAICQLPGCSDARSEHLTEDGLFRIDIALQLSGGQKLAIEVDGPYHFLSDGETLNGSTVLRNQLLENRGWKVISIPVMRRKIVDRLLEAQTLEEQKAYLMRKLEPYFTMS